MHYGKKSKGFGKSYGGAGYRSGYLGNKDPLAAYRQHSAPLDEYSRKLRNHLERPDVSGLSGNFSDTSNYKTNTGKTIIETKLSQKEVDELSEKFLDQAIEEFKKMTNTVEIPQEKYEVMHDTADEIAQRFADAKNNPEDNTTVLDFTKEILEKDSMSNSDILERVEEIREQFEQMRSEALEVRDSLPELEKFAEDMRKAQLFETSGIADETRLEPGVLDIYEPLDQTKRKRNDLGYESEFDAI